MGRSQTRIVVNLPSSGGVVKDGRGPTVRGNYRGVKSFAGPCEPLRTGIAEVLQRAVREVASW